jgi:hypothetical protein
MKQILQQCNEAVVEMWINAGGLESGNVNGQNFETWQVYATRSWWINYSLGRFG